MGVRLRLTDAPRRTPRRVQTGLIYINADHCGHIDPEIRDYLDDEQYLKASDEYNETHEESSDWDSFLICLDSIPGLAIYDLQGQWIRTLINPRKKN